MTVTETPIWTVDELAAAWRVHAESVRKMCADGRLPAFKAGHAWRVTDRAKRTYEDAALVALTKPRRAAS